MRLLYTAAKTRAAFDDPNLVSHAGLVLAVRLAGDAGLEELVTEHVQVAAFGHAKIASKSLLVRGLNARMATVSTPLAAPVVAAARLRGGNAGSARGAATLLAEALGTAREAGASGLIVVRADSAYYAGAFVAACRRGGAHFSVTVRMDPKIRRTITTIGEGSW